MSELNKHLHNLGQPENQESNMLDMSKPNLVGIQVPVFFSSASFAFRKCLCSQGFPLSYQFLHGFHADFEQKNK